MFRIATNKGAIEENNALHKKTVQRAKEIEAVMVAASRVRNATIVNETTIDSKPPSKMPTWPRIPPWHGSVAHSRPPSSQSGSGGKKLPFQARKF